jgi:hypothetical protein
MQMDLCVRGPQWGRNKVDKPPPLYQTFRVCTDSSESIVADTLLDDCEQFCVCFIAHTVFSPNTSPLFVMQKRHVHMYTPCMQSPKHVESSLHCLATSVHTLYPEWILHDNGWQEKKVENLLTSLVVVFWGKPID